MGQQIDVNEHPYTVLGVAPKSFNGTEVFMSPDFWVPMVNEQQVEGDNYLEQRSNYQIWLVGRLKPGVSEQQATENLNAIAAQLQKQYPATDDGLQARLVKPGLMGDVLGGPITCIPVRNYGAGAAGVAGRVREPGQHFCRACRRPRP